MRPQGCWRVWRAMSAGLCRPKLKNERGGPRHLPHGRRSKRRLAWRWSAAAEVTRRNIRSSDSCVTPWPVRCCGRRCPRRWTERSPSGSLPRFQFRQPHHAQRLPKPGRSIRPILFSGGRPSRHWPDISAANVLLSMKVAWDVAEEDGSSDRVPRETSSGRSLRQWTSRGKIHCLKCRDIPI